MVGAVMAMVVPFGWIASQATAFANLYTEITGINVQVLTVALVVICLVCSALLAVLAAAALLYRSRRR